ncbi:MarR family winged helix-turn-helix transcriptional regulator [Pseudoduganella flava]|nr:MarR family winged helix-turn-helix transcriptional regulator [Pseudoduganella flava]QGZ41418.1 MarR family transcriptional regulator [Pseudoduganella flava]
MEDRVARMKAEWARECPGLDSSVMATVGALLQAGRLLDKNWLAPFIARFGLQKGEFDVIATLRRSGTPYELTPTDLYEGLLMTSSAMTSRLDRLERAGLVERHPDPQDRRGVRVRLTEKGLAVIDEILPLHVANEQEALASLDNKEREELDRLLAKVIRGLSAD